jgi:hypothetical protein
VSVRDNQNSPTAAGACAHGFADDRSTVVTVGSISNFVATTNPIFEKAGLAGVADAVMNAGDYASPIMFPTEAGGLTLVGAVGAMVNSLKLNEIGALLIETPTVSALPNFINSFSLRWACSWPRQPARIASKFRAAPKPRDGHVDVSFRAIEDWDDYSHDMEVRCV